MVKKLIVMAAVLEVQEGDFPTAFYVIFSALVRIVRAVLGQGKNVEDISNAFAF